MNDNLLIETKEIGDHRIKIYYDPDAECPVTSWDMAANYIFEHLERGRYLLVDCCDWKEWVSNSREYSMADILQRIAAKVVDQQAIIDYYKAGKVNSFRFIYNQHERLWELQSRLTWKGIDDSWQVEKSIAPHDLKTYDYCSELLDPLDEEDLIALIEECAKDFVIKEWDSCGYYQGDHIHGIAYMSKARYDKYVGGNNQQWKEHALKLIDAGVKDIGMWAWGDVKGYVLEKKVPYTKHYQDSNRKDEESYDWEEVDSCWGFYMETDELIEEVISEHELKEAV